jgi:hypothetical protein
LYLKNSRTQIRIPSGDIHRIFGGYAGVVDIFRIGFTKDDFATSDIWSLNNGGIKTYVSCSTPSIYNAKSASLTFQLLTMWNQMDFDVNGYTDPNNPDTDSDGLSDGSELNTMGGARFEHSDSSDDIYREGKSLYIKNNRMEVQIPSGNIIWNKYWWREETYGTVDLFSLGFNEADFGKNNIWELTSGGIRQYAIVGTTKVDNVVSASLHFEFTNKFPYIFKLDYLMFIDVQALDSTNPIDPDTDRDGLLDGVEVNTYLTDPTDSDTDNDGYNDKYDHDPLRDLKVYVNIKEILQTVNAADVYDFYVKVSINGWKWEQLPPGWYHNKAHEYPNILVSRDVPDTSQYVDIKIELWDDGWDTTHDPDVQLDVSRFGTAVDLTYDVRTGLWMGDDLPKNLGDKNGFGHASGNEDGSFGKGGRDCDIWFDVFQSDFDRDRLPFWQEVKVLDSNPRIPDNDSDSDGMPDWYEVRYGLNRVNPNDAGSDTDGDRLNNKAEYDLGTDPRFYEFNLRVSFEFNAGDSYFGKYETGMKKASDFIYDVTDGHMYFRYIIIEDKKHGWNTADIQVHSGTADSKSDHHWPKAQVGGIDNDDEHITMPEKYDHDNLFGGSSPRSSEYYETIGHEFGHYAFYCYDEYMDINGKDYPDNWYGGNKGPKGMMNNQWKFSEMTTQKSYNDWSPPSGYDTTAHWGERGMSCWAYFFLKYKGKVFFDLDDDGVKDTTYKNSYRSIKGPDVMIDGAYTIIKIIDH